MRQWNSHSSRVQRVKRYPSPFKKTALTTLFKEITTCILHRAYYLHAEDFTDRRAVLTGLKLHNTQCGHASRFWVACPVVPKHSFGLRNVSFSEREQLTQWRGCKISSARTL
ncbi:hypothetical protein AVEN_118255-1 [Araneus ventricosus]|uniref:Uncharacterized protein n=1 Tax=Araneus ventricosus TaxID=182803 RepID=A0A4Y2E080_ARAVE|nr:hypothetical protein AVEN_118255-1 [Araneus ventricosus]